MGKFVLFFSSLFIRTFRQLADQPLGFNPNRVLLLEAVSQHPLPMVTWDQLADALRSTTGVADVSQSMFPLLSGDTTNSFVSVDGMTHPQLASMLEVSPNWLQTMRIAITDGRDFRSTDQAASDSVVSAGTPGQAIVNHVFAREYFGGTNPVGKMFSIGGKMNY